MHSEGMSSRYAAKIPKPRHRRCNRGRLQIPNPGSKQIPNPKLPKLFVWNSPLGIGTWVLGFWVCASLARVEDVQRARLCRFVPNPVGIQVTSFGFSG